MSDFFGTIAEESNESDTYPEDLVQIHDVLTRFEEECNNRLDQLDISLQNLVGKAGLSKSGISATSSTSSCSSIASVDFMTLNSGRRGSELDVIASEDFDFYQTISQVINNIRKSLKTKSSTKRIIEKANTKYVDSSLQRFSTQLTAMMNQQVSQKHQELENEINTLGREIDDLKELAQKEFAELRAAITEIQELQKQKLLESSNKKSQSQKIQSPTLIRKDAVKFHRPKSTNKIPSMTELMLMATRPESLYKTNDI